MAVPGVARLSRMSPATFYHIPRAVPVRRAAGPYSRFTLAVGKLGIPSWAKDKKIGARLINARADGVADKPSFRSAFKSRRCLIPADGFFE